MRSLLKDERCIVRNDKLKFYHIASLSDIVSYLDNSEKKVIFTMGKGGVGKTTVAAAIALGLSKKGKKFILQQPTPQRI